MLVQDAVLWQGREVVRCRGCIAILAFCLQYLHLWKPRDERGHGRIDLVAVDGCGTGSRAFPGRSIGEPEVPTAGAEPRLEHDPEAATFGASDDLICREGSVGMTSR